MNSGLRVVTSKINEVASDIVTVRTGTVISDNAAITATIVTLDNDPSATAVQALCLSGPLPAQTRVMMLAYPDRGLVIIGPFSGNSVFTLQDEIDAIEADILDTGWVAPTLTNSWVNYGGGFEAAGYKKVGTQVFIRGLVKDGAVGTAIFTLPVGFRPTTGICGYAGVGASMVLTAGTLAGGPSPNATGPQIGGAPAHTHTLQGHNHDRGSYGMDNLGVRIDVSSTGTVTLNSANASNAYLFLTGSFNID